MTLQIVPDSAPFSPEQRAWLNGFLSGMLGMLDDQQAQGGSSVAVAAAASLLTPPSGDLLSLSNSGSEDFFPWHDSALPIVDRMQLAEGQPLERRMMAAMAQLDCGSCGYLCKTYAEAITMGSEKNLTLCSPGGSETAKLLRQLIKERHSTTRSSGISPAIASLQANEPERIGTRKRPVVAKWIRSVPLNKPGSAKDTRHVEIDLTDTGLSYQVGDALGMWPSNCHDLVAAVIAASGLDSKAVVSVEKASSILEDALSERCLQSIPPDLVDRAIEAVRNRPKHNGELVKDKQLADKLVEFSESDEMDVLDVLEFFERFENLGLSAQDLVDTLSPIRPRLYSIASSQSVYPQQVHLTVGRVEHEVRGRGRKGVASTMLSDRMQPNSTLRVFVQPSHDFTVPANPDAPMIMVGPGTGIAPFMAFLQKRAFDRASGKNWLFFGDQRSDFDYLYEDQLEMWRENGLLTRLDLAFSRDGADKLYVQHRMKENGAELYSWLEQGGFFFVCGDASRMAADVDRALLDIVILHGKRTPDQAKQYLAELTKSKRYVRDVY